MRFGRLKQLIKEAYFDAFKALGLKPGATPEQIKIAYKKKALELHPDRNIGKDPELAKRMMQDINVAKDILLNPDKRIKYSSDNFDPNKQEPVKHPDPINKQEPWNQRAPRPDKTAKNRDVPQKRCFYKNDHFVIMLLKQVLSFGNPNGYKILIKSADPLSNYTWKSRVIGPNEKEEALLKIEQLCDFKISTGWSELEANEFKKIFDRTRNKFHTYTADQTRGEPDPDSSSRSTKDKTSKKKTDYRIYWKNRGTQPQIRYKTQLFGPLDNKTGFKPGQTRSVHVNAVGNDEVDVTDTSSDHTQRWSKKNESSIKTLIQDLVIEHIVRIANK